MNMRIFSFRYNDPPCVVSSYTRGIFILYTYPYKFFVLLTNTVYYLIIIYNKIQIQNAEFNLKEF